MPIINKVFCNDECVPKGCSTVSFELVCELVVDRQDWRSPDLSKCQGCGTKLADVIPSEWRIAASATVEYELPAATLELDRLGVARGFLREGRRYGEA